MGLEMFYSILFYHNHSFGKQKFPTQGRILHNADFANDSTETCKFLEIKDKEKDSNCDDRILLEIGTNLS